MSCVVLVSLCALLEEIVLDVKISALEIRDIVQENIDSFARVY